MKNDKPVIGVFGHYGNRNLGDESIISATFEQIKKRFPEAEINCFSLRPDDTAGRHGVPAYRIRYIDNGHDNLVLPGQQAESATLPWNVYAQQRRDAEIEAQNPKNGSDVQNVRGLKERLKAMPVIGRAVRFAIRVLHKSQDLVNELGFLVSSYRYLKKFDLLIITGSNQFLDNFGGPWEFPYTLLKWSLMAKLTGTKLAFVSVGANPLEFPMSRKMIHLALKRADYISYRDEASRNLIEDGKTKFKGTVFPDLAFGLDCKVSNNPEITHKPVVGINPMPVYDYRYWCERDDGKYHNYVVNLARFTELLIEQEYPFFLFATMWRDEDVIIDILNEIKPELRKKVEESNIIRHSEQLDQLMDILQEADIIVATRFHGTLLPLLVDTPVLGISYYRKNIDLMNNMGLSAYYEELEQCDVDELWKKFILLVDNLPKEREKIRIRTAEYRDLVGRQWDQVMGLIER